MGACPSQTTAAAARPSPPSRLSKRGIVTGCIMKTAGTGESCCFAGARAPSRSLMGQKLLTAVLNNVDVSTPLRIVIIGGGPVGLALALRLAEVPGRPVNITLYDRRWCKGPDGKYLWADMQPGNVGRRLPRDQVVTVRDEVVDLFKDGSQATHAVFDGEEVWPGSRNISVSELEEKLLARVQEADVNKNICLSPVPYDIAEILAGRDQRRLPDTSLATYRDWIEARLLGGGEIGAALEEQSGVVVAADGADSLTRKAFKDDFEWTTAGGGSCTFDETRHVSDVAKRDTSRKAGEAIDTDYLLGVAFEDDKASSARHRLLSTALSAAQCRFLYSADAANRRGYLNIRLHRKEFISLAQAIGPHVFRPGADRPYWYGEAEIRRLFEQLPWLGQIVREGAKMFDVQDKRIKSIVASYNAPGSAKAFHCVQPNGGVKVCLVGDAAMVHHWFPGRGLEAGLKAADALTRVLHRGAPLSAYGSFMKQLRDHEIRGRSQVMLSQAYVLPDCTELPSREACTDKDEVARFAERVKRLRDLLQGMGNDSFPFPEEGADLSDEDIDNIFADGFPASLPVASGGWPPGMLHSLEVMPTGAFASSTNAWAELAAGRPEQAQTACEEALNAEPGDALSLAMMAAVQLHLGKFEEVADEELLTTEGGVDAFHHSIIAEAKVHLGRYKEALEDCDKALKCEPGNPLAFTVRAEANLRLLRFVEASEDCASAILSAPGTAPAYAVRAQAKLHMNRFEETIVDCDCALSQCESANVLAVRGDANRRLGKLQVAISDCEKALQLKSNLAYALSVRGEAYLDIGELTNCVADLDKALAIAREDQTATTTLSTLTARADAMVRLGRYDEAISNCDEVLQTERKHSLAFAIRAEAKLRSADYDGCIVDCHSALKLMPQDAFTYVVRAEAKLHSNRLDDALRDCDEALAIWPTLDYATMVRERVEQARY